MGAFKKGSRLDKTKVKRGKVMLPELDDGKEKAFIWVRAMTSREIEDKLVTPEGGDEPRIDNSELIALCAVNEDGTPVFDNAEDAKANLEVEGGSLLAIIEKILELSGLKKDRGPN